MDIKFWGGQKKWCYYWIFFYWLANHNPPWAAYRAFMSGRLIALDKHTDVVRLVLGNCGKVFLLSVCSGSQEPKPSICVSMASYVLV